MSTIPACCSQCCQQWQAVPAEPVRDRRSAPVTPGRHPRGEHEGGLHRGAHAGDLHLLQAALLWELLHVQVSILRGASWGWALSEVSGSHEHPESLVT